jgi:hypothetical protein
LGKERKKYACEQKNSKNVWWNMPVIPVLRRLRKENCEFKTSLGYLEITYVKKKKSLSGEENVSLLRVYIHTSVHSDLGFEFMLVLLLNFAIYAKMKYCFKCINLSQPSRLWRHKSNGDPFT